ncbi:MAG: hypothetical protein K0Q95_2151 [Bacteroidota bacterium]|jgi:hypothetical protein|nr:hypothetical protein [Bacteroidota bacterium]
MIITQEEAKTLLLPYAQKFYEAIVEGFNDYITNDSAQAHIHDRTTKANLIRSYILARVKKIVADDPSLRMQTRKKMLVVVIGDRLKIRFKKLDENFKSTNIKTKQVTAFRNHSLVLDDGTSALYLDAGWRLNEYFTEITDVSFVCPNGDRNKWKITAEDLEINKPQIEIFETEEDNILPVVTVKEGLRKKKVG